MRKVDLSFKFEIALQGERFLLGELDDHRILVFCQEVRGEDKVSPLNDTGEEAVFLWIFERNEVEREDDLVVLCFARIVKR